MKIMVAYDGSRNAKLALAQTLTMFHCMSPKIMLVGVAENPRDSSDANEDLFQEEYEELKQALHEGLDFVTQEKLSGEVLLAEGDPRKMILRATQKHNPNLLVIARHSHQPDGGFISRSLNYFVDELDYMTFGSVSSFLARRVEVPVLIYPS
ncbi:universal stress protein [Marinospirillum alkaliphilum]|uniref:Nucleotide-binding universal stress protein, UspA family n=1 Tax=Marinospirillum alkaliphilum DSM 21637 TaxID=1122209 RepID=A0A1K1ZMA7_9GAMM|nr:universal stress protein [Marinospirillum alkaliphilum]SFX75255.1 Nucleotide-binding universal stress protein, UspA family [Marinospirillum alkaliphilum DSM 21637]